MIIKDSDLEAGKVNDVLLEQACQELSSTKKIDVIHDPSDIRKPHKIYDIYYILFQK